jgi:hypothetical protein
MAGFGLVLPKCRWLWRRPRLHSLSMTCRITKLFLIVILLRPAEVCAQAPSVTAERLNAEADSSRSLVLSGDRFPTSHLGMDCGPPSSEKNSAGLTTSECGAPTSTDRVSLRQAEPLFIEAVCSAIAREAMANNLPAEFLTKLIWQESRFNPRARSYKGAEGIAQFMPGTARWRGLEDSYDPFQALHKSARWLAELRDQFGNVGLAAAAYNAGPGRIKSWLSGRASLPSETQHYVRIITGISADKWSQRRVKDTDDLTPETIPCKTIASSMSANYGPRVSAKSVSTDRSTAGPWGLQLIGDRSETRALTDFRKLQERFPALLGNRQPVILRTQPTGRRSATWYRIRVAEITRDRAQDLCRKLEMAGGKCIVLRN